MKCATMNAFTLPSSAASCAASFTGSFLTCSSFTCHLKASVAWVPSLTDDAAAAHGLLECVTHHRVARLHHLQRPAHARHAPPEPLPAKHAAPRPPPIPPQSKAAHRLPPTSSTAAKPPTSHDTAVAVHRHV